MQSLRNLIVSPTASTFAASTCSCTNPFACSAPIAANRLVAKLSRLLHRKPPFAQNFGKIPVHRLHHRIHQRSLIHHLMSKTLQLHQVRMIQRRHPTPPRQNVIAIKVRFDQPYHRRRTRPIRCRKKRAPALRPYQLCKWVDPANRSPFILCPKIHGSLPSWELITKEESPRGQSITVDPEKGAQTNQAHPSPTAIINHSTHKPQRTTHQTKFAR